MKTILIIFSLLLLLNTSIYGRLFFVGSNPYYSIIAFPQNIFWFRKGFTAYEFSYQSSPWWGDVDEPFNKPDNSYTSVYEDITFAKDDKDTDTPYFRKDGSTKIYKHKLYLFKIFGKKLNYLRAYLTLTYKTRKLSSYAEGKARVYDEDTDPYSYVPFTYSSSAKGDNIYIESIIGYKLFNLPIGLKLGFGREKTSLPYSYLNFTSHGINITSERLLWGWSTKGCNHIFGYHHANADAWYQNEYSIGSIYQYDIQLGTDISRFKIGGRFRKRTGKLDSYIWKTSYPTDSTDPVEILKENFYGSYQKSKWAKGIDETIIRAYSNVNLLNIGKIYKINILIFLSRDSYTAKNVYSEDPNITNEAKERFINYIIETNPNVNIYLTRWITIDAAILLEYSKTRYENTYPMWIASIGGIKTVYWNTKAYTGDEKSWENFSYADEHFYDIGEEIDVSINLINSRYHKLHIFIMLMRSTKYTYQTKYYGENETTDSGVTFKLNNIRKNYKRETWLNSAISIFYKYKKFIFRITYFEPLVYTIYTSTSVYDGNYNLLYSHRIEMQTAVQESAHISIHPAIQGGSIWFFMIGYEI